MIAVVGGRGFIGGAVVAALRADGHEVVVVTHDRRQGGQPGVRHGDLLIPDTLASALEGAEVVIQSATFPTFPVEKPRRRHTFLEFDALGTERLVAAAQAASARRFIYVSGCGTGPDSPRPYFQAHWRGEQAVAGSGLEPVVLRPAFVFGPRDNGLNRILAMARRSPWVPVIGSGRQLHQPVFIEDVASVARQLVAPGAPTGVFEVGGPERVTIDWMLQTLFRVAGLDCRLVHFPKRFMKRAVSLLRRFPGPPLTPAAIDFFCEDFVADLDTLQPLEIELTPLEIGLPSYLA